jgi:hypothetical protein
MTSAHPCLPGATCLPGFTCLARSTAGRLARDPALPALDGRPRLPVRTSEQTNCGQHHSSDETLRCHSRNVPDHLARDSETMHIPCVGLPRMRCISR